MHILVLSDGFPFPLTSGRLRQYHLVRGLARSHRISLVSAVAPGHPVGHAAMLGDVVDRIETIPTQRLSPRFLAKARGRLLRRSTRDVERRIAAIDSQDPFDVVLNARLPVPFRSILPDVPVVTDLCDAVPEGIVSRIRAATPLEVPLLIAKHRDALRAEHQMTAHADHIVLASARDRGLLVLRSGRLPPISIVPNGVDSDHWRRRDEALGRDTVMFTGAMPYAPNHDAAMYLIDEIMPIVWQTRPSARLEIVGRDPRPRLLAAAARHPNVVVTGFVEDMRDHIERASVIAAPLRMGTGIQNKVLEAMSMAVPVVTTPVGEAGLLIPGHPPPPIAVAADAADLAALIVAGLEAADRDTSPDERARTWVRERFTWEEMVDRLDRAIGQAVSDHRRGRIRAASGAASLRASTRPRSRPGGSASSRP